MDPIYFNAGQKRTFELELNFADTLLSRDWSVVAWGEHGVVSVKHSKRYKSAELPVLDRRVRPPKPAVDPGFEDIDALEPEIHDSVDNLHPILPNSNDTTPIGGSDATIIPGFEDPKIKDNPKPSDQNEDKTTVDDFDILGVPLPWWGKLLDWFSWLNILKPASKQEEPE